MLKRFQNLNKIYSFKLTIFSIPLLSNGLDQPWCNKSSALYTVALRYTYACAFWRGWPADI